MLSKLYQSLRLIVLPAVVLLGACDNPVGNNDDDHLEEVVGVEVTDLLGNVITEYHDGHWDLAGGADALHLHVGEEEEIRIFFVAEDGDRFQLPHSGAEYTLRVEIANTAIVEYEGEGDHGHLNAKSVGETTARVQIYHGNHPDWETLADLPIEVGDHTH